MSGRRSLSARELAARVLSRVLDEGAWVAPALDAELVRHGGKMSAADRGLATELVYGTLRWLVPLEKSLLRGAKKPGRGLDDRILNAGENIDWLILQRRYWSGQAFRFALLGSIEGILGQ